MKTKYQNPAKLFLEHNQVLDFTDILDYVYFLRNQSGLTENPPVNLNAIHKTFGIPFPHKIAMQKQYGALVEIEGVPQIFLKKDDPYFRQRFSQAHELIELLFIELSDEFRFDGLRENIFGGKKENMCQKGAAHLLMPENSFQPKALELGLSFQAGVSISKIYEVSLTAALFRLVDQFPNSGAVILWKMKNKPSEMKRRVPENQFAMPGFNSSAIAQTKLRVEWAYGKFKNIYIPKDKSIPKESLVYQTWNTNNYSSGVEVFPFGKSNTSALVESIPVRIEKERFVLSLVR